MSRDRAGKPLLFQYFFIKNVRNIKKYQKLFSFFHGKNYFSVEQYLKFCTFTKTNVRLILSLVVIFGSLQPYVIFHCKDALL